MQNLQSDVLKQQRRNLRSNAHIIGEVAQCLD